jgi:hypothetical protein
MIQPRTALIWPKNHRLKIPVSAVRFCLWAPTFSQNKLPNASPFDSRFSAKRVLSHSARYKTGTRKGPSSAFLRFLTIATLWHAILWTACLIGGAR